MCSLPSYLPGSSCLLQWLQGWVERAVAAVAAVVGCRPAGVRLDAVANAYAPCDRLRSIREDAGAHAREEGGPERRSFLRLGALEWQVEHRGDDAQPEAAR